MWTRGNVFFVFFCSTQCLSLSKQLSLLSVPWWVIKTNPLKQPVFLAVTPTSNTFYSSHPSARAAHKDRGNPCLYPPPPPQQRCVSVVCGGVRPYTLINNTYEAPPHRDSGLRPLLKEQDNLLVQRKCRCKTETIKELHTEGLTEKSNKIKNQ